MDVQRCPPAAAELSEGQGDRSDPIMSEIAREAEDGTGVDAGRQEDADLYVGHEMMTHALAHGRLDEGAAISLGPAGRRRARARAVADAVMQPPHNVP